MKYIMSFEYIASQNISQFSTVWFVGSLTSIFPPLQFLLLMCAGQDVEVVKLKGLRFVERKGPVEESLKLIRCLHKVISFSSSGGEPKVSELSALS